MTQEFHISVTPIGEDEYLVRTERVAPGVPLAEEQVRWPVEDWLAQASVLMNDPLLGLLRGDNHALPSTWESAGAAETATQPSANLVALGQELYNALFQGMIRDSWMTARGIARHRREVLRLRLGLKDTRLPRLPWEVLYAGDRPLAAGTDVLFSRYHSSFAALASSLQLQHLPESEPKQPLRILMVLAAPTDQEMLALKQEALHLQEELQNTLANGAKGSRYSGIELTILDQPGREKLTQTLEHNHYQVFHYAGHSNLGASGGNLYLVSSRTGLTEILSGDDLAGLLVNNGIRMAVFNSCRGVYTATLNPKSDSQEGNLAEALIKRGIPAVLAMAERIPDDVALNLSRLFYRNLKQAYSIDLSLNRARQGLISSYGSNQLYWALPILYLHPQFDGYLQAPGPDEGDYSLGELQSNRAGLVLDGPVSALPTITELEAGEEAEFLNGAVLSGEDDSLDPDEIEFDDPDYAQDLEAVAQLVKQLSQNPTQALTHDRPLPAPPGENLLPEESGFKLDYPDLSHPSAFSTPPTGADLTPDRHSAAEATVQAVDPAIYAELERMLADAGKLTDAIALCSQAIQRNPSDAAAYDNLGWALYDQGYLNEAISAYSHALQINPKFAKAHNHLGLAFYEQGNINQAIDAYKRAIEHDSSLTEAYRNLRTAQRKQTPLEQLPADVEPTSQPHQVSQAAVVSQPAASKTSGNIVRSFAEEPAHSFPPAGTQVKTAVATVDRPVAIQVKPPIRKPLLWRGAGILGVAALMLGGWFAFTQLNRSPAPDADQPTPALTAANNAPEVKNDLAALAAKQLSQGDIPAAQQSIETLLDQNALSDVETVLTPVLNKQSDNSTIAFLMGRLAWQSVQAGNKNYSLDDARRYWERAAKLQPVPLHQNALGFAYYEEGKLDRASRTWFEALEQLDEQPSTKGASLSESRPSQNSSIAYAGMAMVLMKSAQGQPPSRRASLLSEAIKLRQKVLANDTQGFQPEALSKNWMWSKKAVQDWRSLLALK